MYRRAGDYSAFAKYGLARREVFGHLAIALPKAYPDAQLLLEKRGMPSHDLAAGCFAQINIYTTDFYGLPDELFWHPEINWHHQQLGLKGLIAAAGLWLRDNAATITTLQSDLCQQLYRHPRLRNTCKTQVETHFKYWYAILFNAVLDYCAVAGLSVLYSPTGEQIVGNTTKLIAPALFLRIYNYPEKHYQCRRIMRGGVEYWEIPVDANLSRLARLRPCGPIPARDKSGRPQICIFHDIEENVDTNISAAACADNLRRMLAIEKEFNLETTYDVLGTLLGRKQSEIWASNPRHSIAFHSFNHRIEDLTQLQRCREVDLRVRGYRPPRSRMTAELKDYNLTFLNFEWLASSVFSLGFDRCKLENGLVKIPIDLDDYPLFTGAVGYEQWERNLLERASEKQFFAFGVHDCYAELWLTRYPQLLHKLREIGDFVSADALCDRIFLEENGESLKHNEPDQGASASEFEAICRYAAREGLKRFVLHGSRTAEYVAEQAPGNFAYRETGRAISVATSPKGRPRIKAPVALFGNVISTQPACASSIFWCLDLLKSGYAFVHFPTPFGPQRVSLIEQLARNCLARAGWAATAQTSVHAAVAELAKPRDPSYAPNAKRILMITSTFIRGGNERQMITTASALLGRGYDVRILAFGSTAPGTPTIEHEIVKLGIKPEFLANFLSIEKPFEACFDAEALLKIYQLPTWLSARAGPVATAIRHHRPAVVHCWLEMPGMIAALAACALGVPRVVLGLRNGLGHMQTSGYTEEIKGFLASAYPTLARNPNTVILNNSALEAQKYERAFGLPRKTIRILYNGFAPDTLRKPAAHEVLEFRNRFGCDADTPIVGTLMRFVRQKDPELWIEVAAEVAAAKPDARFLLGGYGEMESTITARIKALGLAEKVIMLDLVEDISLFYFAVDVIVLTSIAEGTPNVLIEAQAAGRPVVAPDVGGVAEAMVSGLSGHVVATRSAKHLAKAIVTVLDDHEWRKNAAIQGPAFVAKRFGVDRMLRETLEAYGPGSKEETNGTMANAAIGLPSSRWV
jgi:glycosyltransferase involved in cell wall biosynthesis